MAPAEIAPNCWGIEAEPYCLAMTSGELGSAGIHESRHVHMREGVRGFSRCVLLLPP